MHRSSRHPIGNSAASRQPANENSAAARAPAPVPAHDMRRSAATQRRLIDAIASSPVAHAQRARFERAGVAAASTGTSMASGSGAATVQRLVYFTDADGASASASKPSNYPMWESPLKGTDQALYNTAGGARGAAVGALNVGALEDMSNGDPTAYSGGGAPANGNYEFWLDTNSNHVFGHAEHTQDDTNTLTRITKSGKQEKRATYKPVVHDHAVDYGVQVKPYDLLANPGYKYNKAAGALDHYLQKPAV